MTIISFNKPLVHRGYERTISEMYVPLANSFYNKFKGKDIKIIERYSKVLSAQNIFDSIFCFDNDRLTKFAAVKRILYENNQKNLEDKFKK